MRPFFLTDELKKMFQLYWSSLSAKYEDVDQGNTDEGTTKREEWTGLSLYAGIRSVYMFIVYFSLLQNTEQKGSQSLLSSVRGAEAVIDKALMSGSLWRFRTGFTERLQCTQEICAKSWSWLLVC